MQLLIYYITCLNYLIHLEYFQLGLFKKTITIFKQNDFFLTLQFGVNHHKWMVIHLVAL